MAFKSSKGVIYSPAGMEHSYTGSYTKITAIPEPGDLVGIDAASEINSGSKIDMISFGNLTQPEASGTYTHITSSFFLPFGTSIEAPICRITATGTGSLLITTGIR